MKQAVDLAGQTFGRLTAIEFAGRDALRKRLWRCACTCGRETLVNTGNLRSGTTRSCGCLKAETVRTACLTHGGKANGKMGRAYRAWRAAKNRCYYAKNAAYPKYGGRGIVMCDEWKSDFAAFLAHVGEPDDQTLELDRIDSNGHYEPGNVRWATRREQVCNTRRTVFVEYGDRRMVLKDFAREMGVSYTHLGVRVREGADPVEAALKIKQHPEHQRRRQKTETAATPC
jgi:hypothetical protein